MPARKSAERGVGSPATSTRPGVLSCALPKVRTSTSVLVCPAAKVIGLVQKGWPGESASSAGWSPVPLIVKLTVAACETLPVRVTV